MKTEKDDEVLAELRRIRKTLDEMLSLMREEKERLDKADEALFT